MSPEVVQPEGWDRPRGYSNGMLAAPGARTLFVAGQIAWNPKQELVGAGDFVAQFRQALANVVAVVLAAGGKATDLASLTIYVTDKRQYIDGGKEIGAVYRECMGKHFPTMALVEVADLLEEGALVEIQALASVQ